MKSEVAIDVAAIDAPHRRALEEVMGRELSSNERLIISIVEATANNGSASVRPTLPDYCNVFDGLSDQELAELDSAILDRSPSRSAP